jgi:hypothetical protein
MTRCFIFVGIVLTLVCSVSAENLVVQNTKIYRHHSAKDRIFVEQAGGLTFDNSTEALTFTDNKGYNLHISYADVNKVVFEVDTHMRGGSSPLWALGGAVGAGIGAARAGRHVTDYWMYVAPAVNKGTPFLLVVPKDSSDEVIEKAKAIFAERVEMADFPEKGADIDKTTLADIQSKEAVKVDKDAHPVPEIKPDKALIVVVCPALSPRGAGVGLPFKLYANGHVTAANRNGTSIDYPKRCAVTAEVASSSLVVPAIFHKHRSSFPSCETLRANFGCSLVCTRRQANCAVTLGSQLRKHRVP